MTTHFVIPDVQCKAGHNTQYLAHIGSHIISKRPDVVICLGDFADLPSLSSYDVGTKAFEGRRYKTDIAAVHEGMETLLNPINAYNAKAKKARKQQYKPRWVMLNGNHENRIVRATNSDPKLDGTIGLSDLKYEEYGWEVHPFLDVVVIDGIAYSHYHTSGIMGRPCVTAQQQLNRKHQSCIAGHQQGFQIATGYRADGVRLTSIIAGSAYEHDESYLNQQTNNHWRGCLMLHNVDSQGQFDCVPIPLSYLKNKYAG